MAGKDNFQLAVEALAKMVQDGTIVPILKPKMRVIVNGPATVLYVGEEKQWLKSTMRILTWKRGLLWPS